MRIMSHVLKLQLFFICFHSFFSGTKDFSVFASNDPHAWDFLRPLYSGTLADVRGKNCTDINIESLNITTEVESRYVLFWVESHYGIGGGLQFVGLAHSSRPGVIEGTTTESTTSSTTTIVDETSFFNETMTTTTLKTTTTSKAFETSSVLITSSTSGADAIVIEGQTDGPASSDATRYDEGHEDPHSTEMTTAVQMTEKPRSGGDKNVVSGLILVLGLSYAL